MSERGSQIWRSFFPPTLLSLCHFPNVVPILCSSTTGYMATWHVVKHAELGWFINVVYLCRISTEFWVVYQTNYCAAFLKPRKIHENVERSRDILHIYFRVNKKFVKKNKTVNFNILLLYPECIISNDLLSFHIFNKSAQIGRKKNLLVFF